MMDDLISRKAAIDAPEKFIKDCNPEHFVGHQKFIEFMDDAEIGSFGNWQFANGFNLGLTAAEVEIKNLPSAQPDVLDTNVGKWIPCDKGKPDPYRRVLMTERRPDWNGKEYYIVTLDSFCNHRGDVVAWMLLPEPFKEDEE